MNKSVHMGVFQTKINMYHGLYSFGISIFSIAHGGSKIPRNLKMLI